MSRGKILSGWIRRELREDAKAAEDPVTMVAPVSEAKLRGGAGSAVGVQLLRGPP
jgi:hypothetical protein